MRGYLLRICGIFLISAVAEMIMPDTNVKKYSKILLSILVCITLLSPVFPKAERIKTGDDVKIKNTLQEEITKEYKNRVEKMISDKCKTQCKVILLEERQIEKVIIYGKCTDEGKSFLNNEMGVKDENIVYIENQ